MNQHLFNREEFGQVLERGRSKRKELLRFLEPLHERHLELGRQVARLHEALHEEHSDFYVRRNGPKQTGFVYFVTQLPPDSEMPDKVKVGSSVHPARRVKNLQTGNPLPLLLRHIILSHNAKRLERRIQHQLKSFEESGEWFVDDSMKAHLMYHSDSPLGMSPHYSHLDRSLTLGLSIASHYFNFRIDLQDDLVSNELVELEEKYEESRHDILAALKDCGLNLFDV